MKKYFFVFLLLIFATFLFSQQAADLFISEYVEGSSYHKAIEIFNGTGQAVDLSIYSLKIQRNGNGDFGNELMLQDSLANNDVYVIVYDHGGDGDLTEYDFVDLATTSQAMSFNGNDAIALCKNGDPLDIVGEVNSSEDWGKNITLVRNSNVSMPTINYNPQEWTDYPSDTFDYLGFHEFAGGDDHYLMLLSPNGGEQWEQGSLQFITWTSLNYAGNIKIELLTSTQNREILVESTENDGQWEWNISDNQPIADNYLIKISSVDSLDLEDTSDDTFSIIEPIPYTPYSIYEIQNSSDGPSPHNGERIITSGVVTAIFNSTYFIQDGEGAWNGICVYDTNTEIAIGDKISLKAIVQEYNDKTELTEVSDLEILGQYPLPEPTLITTTDLSSMEEYEGVLVRIANATVTDDSLGYGEWEITDDSGTGCRVDDLGEYTYIPVDNDIIHQIVGVVEYSYGNYKLEPRTDSDIDLIGLEILPFSLVFDDYDEITGLDFTIYNFADSTITINAIQTEGMFDDADCVWSIITDNITLPYLLNSNSSVSFTVMVGIPVNKTGYISSEIPIETTAGNFTEKIYLNSSLLNSENQDVISPQQSIQMNIYPNPFVFSNSKSIIKIKYILPTEQKISLSIYNLKGQLVKNLYSGLQNAGTYVFNWDVSDNKIASGIYLVRLKTKNSVTFKKIVSIK